MRRYFFGLSSAIAILSSTKVRSLNFSSKTMPGTSHFFVCHCKRSKAIAKSLTKSESMRLLVYDTHLRSLFLLSTRRTRVRNDSYFVSKTVCLTSTGSPVKLKGRTSVIFTFTNCPWSSLMLPLKKVKRLPPVRPITWV